MRKADIKFQNARVGDPVKVWLNYEERSGVIVVKHEGGTALEGGHTSIPFLRVEFTDGKSPKTKMFTIKALYGWSSFRVAYNGLDRARRRIYNGEVGEK